MVIDTVKLEKGRDIFKKISQSNEIKNTFKSLIDRPSLENNEYGIGICSKIKSRTAGNSLIMTSPCIEIGCKAPPICPENSKLVADFHTHLKRLKPTEEDMGITIDRKLNISCIGTIEDNKKMVKCYYPYFHKRRIFTEDIGMINV